MTASPTLEQLEQEERLEKARAAFWRNFNTYTPTLDAIGRDNPRDWSTDYAAGHRHGRSDAAVMLRNMARNMRARAKGCTYAMTNAATLEQAADALAEMENGR